MRMYGITLEQLQNMFELAGGKCEICATPLHIGGVKNEGRAVVDHDHVSGKVRGILCHRCNSGLGHLGDSVEGLFSAVQYLKKGIS